MANEPQSHTSAQEALDDAIRGGDLQGCHNALMSSPGYDINTYAPYWYTALDLACELDQVHIVKWLLMHPKIEVNAIDTDRWNPMFARCVSPRSDVLRTLLADPRSDAGWVDYEGKTLLGRVACNKLPHCVGRAKWMIASGRDLQLQRVFKQSFFDFEGTALEAARRISGNPEMIDLLERFTADPHRTRRLVQLELGVPTQNAAGILALVIFLCEQLLSIPVSCPGPEARFFSVALRLPLELQMILCRRAADSRQDFILTDVSEPAFRSLAQKYLFLAQHQAHMALCEKNI